MRYDEDGVLRDANAGRLVPSYYRTRGRTKPTHELDLLTLVCSTGKVRVKDLGEDQGEVLLLCREPIAVAEIAAQMREHAAVVKILVSDLIDADAVETVLPQNYTTEIPDEVLEAVLAGLQARL